MLLSCTDAVEDIWSTYEVVIPVYTCWVQPSCCVYKMVDHVCVMCVWWQQRRQPLEVLPYFSSMVEHARRRNLTAAFCPH